MGGGLDIFTLTYPFSPLSPSLWETARYRLKYCLKGPLNPKQPTNQPTEKRGKNNRVASSEIIEFKTGTAGTDIIATLKSLSTHPIKGPGALHFAKGVRTYPINPIKGPGAMHFAKKGCVHILLKAPGRCILQKGCVHILLILLKAPGRCILQKGCVHILLILLKAPGRCILQKGCVHILLILLKAPGRCILQKGAPPFAKSNALGPSIGLIGYVDMKS